MLELLALAAFIVSAVSLYLSLTSRLKLGRVLLLLRAALGPRRARPVRPRRRYLVFELIAVSGSLTDVKRPDLERAFENASKALYGALGYSLIRPSLVYYDESRGIGILSFKHTWRGHVILLLSLVREVGGVRVVVVPVATTGTRKKAMKLARRR